MKRTIFIFLLLLKFGLTKAQQWVTNKCDSSAWVHIDTLNKYSDSSKWVYSGWTQVPYTIPDSAHRYYRKEKQYKYRENTGFLMERTRVTEYIFIPKSKTEYEKIMDSVAN